MMVVAAAASRLLPHPMNFAPITAMALFGGATFERRWQAVLVLFAAMFVSDCGIQAAHHYGLSRSWGFHSGWWVVYGTYAMIVGIGLLLRHRRRPVTIALATDSSSVLFFVVTNFAVWAGGTLYPLTVRAGACCFATPLRSRSSRTLCSVTPSTPRRCSAPWLWPKRGSRNYGHEPARNMHEGARKLEWRPGFRLGPR
jgi:hypothetical protein